MASPPKPPNSVGVNTDPEPIETDASDDDMLVFAELVSEPFGAGVFALAEDFCGSPKNMDFKSSLLISPAE